MLPTRRHFLASQTVIERLCVEYLQRIEEESGMLIPFLSQIALTSAQWSTCCCLLTCLVPCIAGSAAGLSLLLYVLGARYPPTGSCCFCSQTTPLTTPIYRQASPLCLAHVPAGVALRAAVAPMLRLWWCAS